MTISPVHSTERIAEVARLAREIWQQHYTPIIGQQQVNYMLDRFQSAEAIAAQLRDGYEYYLATHDDQNAGYAAVVPNPSDATLLLSKLYVRNSARGFGRGKHMLHFVVDLGRKCGFTTLSLAVNK